MKKSTIHAEQTIKRIQSVLNSELTPYRIAKEVGYAGANPVHDLISGKSDVMKMQIGTAVRFEKLYEEMKKMENVKTLITMVENGKMGLVDRDPNFHEVDYTGDATDLYIIHEIEGEELEVFFSERDFIKELRGEVYSGDKNEEDLIEVIDSLNDLEDRFDYDKVVAYKINNGQIEWV